MANHLWIIESRSRFEKKWSLSTVSGGYGTCFHTKDEAQQLVKKRRELNKKYGIGGMIFFRIVKYIKEV